MSLACGCLFVIWSRLTLARAKATSPLTFFFCFSPPKTINVTLPYVKEDIPVVIAFRALGFEDDRSILEHILYDFDDMEMMELLKPSIEKALVVQSREVRFEAG